MGMRVRKMTYLDDDLHVVRERMFVYYPHISDDGHGFLVPFFGKQPSRGLWNCPSKESEKCG